MLVGCWWFFGVLTQPLADRKNWDDYLFSTILMLMMGTPGVIAAYFGFRLIREKTKKNIKGSVGLLVSFAVIILDVFVEWWVLPNHIGTPSSLLIMTIVVILIYIPISRFLMLREGLTPKPNGEFVGKKIILIIAIEIFVVGSEMIHAYSPNNFEPRPLRIVAILIAYAAPILIAWIFYKVAMKFIQEDKTEQVANDKINEPGQI